MSFLIIGNDFVSLYFAKILVDFGWRVILITANTFDFEKDLAILDTNLLTSLGFDYKEGLVNEINTLDVIDLNKNVFSEETKTRLIDLSVYKTKMFNAIKNKIDFFENTSFIDQNGENVFLTVGNKGHLVKVKNVLNFEDFKIVERFSNPIQYKSCVSGIVKSNKNIAKLFFLNRGYGFICKYYDNDSYLMVVGENSDLEFNNFVRRNDFEIVSKYKHKIPLYAPKYKLKDKNVLFGGLIVGITNNLNMTYMNSCLEYCITFKTYFHDMMTSKVEDYETKFEKTFSYLAEYQKKGDFFWGLSPQDKNDIIRYYKPKNGVLEFDTMFNNLPAISKHRIKLFFSG
jgi:hypothetical protein